MRVARCVTATAAAMVAVAVIAACGGDSAGPGDDDTPTLPAAGTWLLTAMDSKALPVRVPSVTVEERWRVAGYLDVYGDARATLYRVDSVAGDAIRDSWSSDLAFYVESGALLLRHANVSAWPSDTVAVSGDRMTVRITQDNDGDGARTLSFERISATPGAGR